ncbi:unnamed protein product [Allacma fusca]|uniref:Uncharacterized protein n=1 Tax=Allacma fusca TaxID=39272 RepID=A0A8J2NTI3_9HEXA|nr:unnamed protein product [Allacma fusca]
MVGNCGCVDDLDLAPINVAGVVRPGRVCGRCQEVFCDREVPASVESSAWVIALGVGAGVVGVGVLDLKGIGKKDFPTALFNNLSSPIFTSMDLTALILQEDPRKTNWFFCSIISDTA